MALGAVAAGPGPGAGYAVQASGAPCPCRQQSGDARDVPAGRAPLMPAESDGRSIRRIELTLHKPWFALYGGIRPTLVIAGLGQPAQWGIGTWQVPADETVTVGVYLFNRMWRFGRAEIALAPS